MNFRRLEEVPYLVTVTIDCRRLGEVPYLVTLTLAL